MHAPERAACVRATTGTQLTPALKGAAMSNMTNILASKIFLEVCMGIEGLCADLYHSYSTMFADTPEASRLWKKTALEEENHRMQFELALRLFSETEFEVPKESLKRAFSVHCNLLKLKDSCTRNRPELLAAVSQAVEMEANLADLHVHTALHFSEPTMQNMFKALSDADRDHVAGLQRYQAMLRLPLVEMTE
jgi:rubrerythrin